jgi:hypothetical protein
VVAVIENHPETAVLYASYKPLLFSLAYRMLGSVMDADAIPSEQDHNVRLPAYEPTAGVVEQFMHALANADVGQLLNVLSPDATLFTDGGGKVTAPPRPIRGSERISVFLAGLPAKVPSVLSFHTTVVNGQPGIVAHTNGQTIVVFSFKMDNGSIAELYAVVNPAKLKHVK